MRAIPLGREEEAASIYTLLKNAIQNKEHGILYVSGMPGCGKTLTCTSVLEIIKEKYSDVNMISINCGSLILPTDIFVEIHRKIEPSTRESSPRMVETCLRTTLYTIILADEIDMLITKNQNVLYGLLEMPSQCKNVYIIAVSNTYNLPDKRLTPKIRSRLGWNRINFAMYKRAQIVQILKENKTGIQITQEAIEYCANKICALNGDVRKAFQIQKYASDQTKKRSLTEVGIEEMDRAIKYAFHSMQSTLIRSLSEYQKILLMLTAQKTAQGSACTQETLYGELKTVLSLRTMPAVTFSEMQVLLAKMEHIGVLVDRKIKNTIETEYIPEELDVILKEQENDELEIINTN